MDVIPEDLAKIKAFCRAGCYTSAAAIGLQLARNVGLDELPQSGEGTAAQLLDALESAELLLYRLRKRIERGLDGHEAERLPAVRPPQAVEVAAPLPMPLPEPPVPGTPRRHHKTVRAQGSPTPGTVAWRMLRVMEPGHVYTVNELAAIAQATYNAVYDAAAYYPWFDRQSSKAVVLTESGRVESEKLRAEAA